MSRRFSRRSVPWVGVTALMAASLGGCTTTPVAEQVTAAGSPATVAYSNGQYRLYGSGTTASPYYWVWIPAGAVAPAPPMTTASPTVAYPSGQYQLRGDGTPAAPYYWVWVPTGSTVAMTLPQPPVLPVSGAAVAQPAGEYQLYGRGTSASPYYWVWVPSGSVVPPPPPPPR